MPTTITFAAFSAREHLLASGLEPELVEAHSEGDLRAYYDEKMLADDTMVIVYYDAFQDRRRRFDDHIRKLDEEAARAKETPAVPPSPVREFKVGDRVVCMGVYTGAVVDGSDERSVDIRSDSDGEVRTWGRQAVRHADPSPPVSGRDWDGEARAIDSDAAWEWLPTDFCYGWALVSANNRDSYLASQSKGGPARAESPGLATLARLVEDRNASDDRNGPDRYRRVEDWDARAKALGGRWRETFSPSVCCRWVLETPRVAIDVRLDGGSTSDDRQDHADMLALVQERNADQLAAEAAKRGMAEKRCSQCSGTDEVCRERRCYGLANGHERPVAAHGDFLAVMAGAK